MNNDGVIGLNSVDAGIIYLTKLTSPKRHRRAEEDALRDSRYLDTSLPLV
jgi:hypothetical protein